MACTISDFYRWNGKNVDVLEIVETGLATLELQCQDLYDSDDIFERFCNAHGGVLPVANQFYNLASKLNLSGQNGEL